MTSVAGIPARGLRAAGELVADRPHGIRLRYMAGCRCLKCRMANSNYETARARARRAGDWNGVVSAERSRAHILALSKQGVGRSIVASVSGVAKSTVCEVRAGTKLRIRARTERKILAVTKDMRGDAALIPAAQTWRLVRLLQEEGFTKAELARRLGRKSPALQINSKVVTARTAHEVARLYRKLTT